jgi:hypothetical protein
LAKHRKAAEDSDDLTDIIAVEVPIETPEPQPIERPKPKPKPGVRPPPWERPAARKTPTNVKPGGFTPMFKGFDRTAPQPKATQPRARDPLVAERDPEPEPPVLTRRRNSILALAVGLALVSFALMIWTLASQPGCPKPPPLRPPFTVTVTPSTIPQTR